LSTLVIVAAPTSMAAVMPFIDIASREGLCSHVNSFQLVAALAVFMAVMALMTLAYFVAFLYWEP
jgi:uncharacterized membrane protein YqjE